jgi:hypothetical protein
MDNVSKELKAVAKYWIGDLLKTKDFSGGIICHFVVSISCEINTEGVSNIFYGLSVNPDDDEVTLDEQYPESEIICRMVEEKDSSLSP